MRETIDRYQIKEEIGRGGMATVYSAHDPRVKRDVVIKVLLKQLVSDPLFRERFEREARTIAALDHPAIVPIYDVGEDEGDPFIVMRYMMGGSLFNKLEKDGAMSVTDSAIIIDRMAAALDEAHSKGIVHRDLKPANILFDQYNNAYLSDFGIVKLLQQNTGLTTSSLIVGTPAYMSPEQVEGEAEIDGRSDIYALGVILYEMLVGEMPYQADTPLALAVKHVFEPIPRVLAAKPDLPNDVEAIIQKAMAKDRKDRYPTAGAMARELLKLAGTDITALSARSGDAPAKPAEEKKEEAKPAEAEKKEEATTAAAAATPVAAAAATPAADKPAEAAKPAQAARPAAAPATDTGEVRITGELVRQELTRVQEEVKRRVPIWGWVLGGMALMALIVIFALGRGRRNAAALPVTEEPTEAPTVEPTEEPTDEPTEEPTEEPTDEPTEEPTEEPIEEPTEEPTDEPTEEPTEEATEEATEEPTEEPGAAGEGNDPLIAYGSGGGGQVDIFIIEPNGFGEMALTDNAAGNRHPTWSADGQTIAFRSMVDGVSQIMSVSVEGGEVTQLTDGETNSYAPAWSPDGTQIAFVSERDGNPEIYTMDPDGSNVQRITREERLEVQRIGWSPDGAKFVFNARSTSDGNVDIYTVNADGTDVQRLTDHIMPDYTPAWSPAGDKIVFVSERDGNAEVYLMDTDGQNVERLTDNGSADSEPSWSKDGTQIVYISREDVNREVYLLTVETGELFRVTATDADEFDPVWRP